MKPAEDLCPCGSARGYQQCCRQWHEGTPAPDAASLMRSRYTAYAVRHEGYLLATWHPRTRPQHIAFDPHQRWLELRLLGAKLTDAAAAEVEFIARYRVGGGTAQRLHERSRFVLDSGRWLYVDGDIVE